MTDIVLDAGVYLAEVLPDQRSANISALFHRIERSRLSIHAPALLRYEFVSVVRKSVHQQRIKPERGGPVLETLFSYPVTLHFEEPLLRRAYELAEAFSQPSAYDAQYLALAERLTCELWTADERLFNRIHEQFAWIRWVGHVPPNSQ